jgi:thiamine pyrophosphate-dependent acetolactate synthase large subunit-like protein
MVVLGGGAVRSSDEAVRLVERLNAPVVSSCAGKGIVPEDHPLCLGFAQPFEPVQEMIGEADVVLAVGTEFAEPDRYFTDDYGIAGKLIRIDIDPEQLMGYSRPEIALLSDARLALATILEAIEETGAPRVATPGAERVAAMRERFDGDLCPDSPKHRRVLEVVREVLPEETLISADPAQMVYTALYHYPMRRAGCFQYPNGYAAMGFALPFAIGAKVGAPDRPVVCLTGDGCFQMTVEELAVAVERKLTLPIIVWTNGGYQEIREYMRSSGLPNVGSDIQNPDFAALGQAFGGDGVRVQGLDHLRQALAGALDADGPTVLEIDGDAPWLA